MAVHWDSFPHSVLIITLLNEFAPFHPSDLTSPPVAPHDPGFHPMPWRQQKIPPMTFYCLGTTTTKNEKKTRQQKHKNNINKHDQTGNLPKKIPILSNSGFKQVASIAARCSAAKVKSTLCRFDLQRFADLAW